VALNPQLRHNSEVELARIGTWLPHITYLDRYLLLLSSRQRESNNIALFLPKMGMKEEEL
jgi:hypothetical protein